MPYATTPTAASPLPPSRVYWHGVRGPELNPGAQVGSSVPAGKRLYITSLLFMCQNEDLTAKGQIKIKDGSTGGTVRLAFTLPPRATGTNAVLATVPLTFPTPLEFDASPFIVHDAGTLTVSISMTGYVE